MTDIVSHNRKAWDRAVEESDIWTRPVTEEEISQAKVGNWEIVLTPHKPIPQSWFPSSMTGVRVLCLASGGGQQGPILAAAGAKVTVFDNSPKQLAQDRFVADRDQLELITIQGDMADLSVFDNRSFDLIIHPVSNCFCENIIPVWQEAYRVLKKGGSILSGFMNPIVFSLNPELLTKGVMQMIINDSHSPKGVTEKNSETMATIEFAHSLEDQIGGQIRAGLVIDGFYEDIWGDRQQKRHPDVNYMEENQLDRYFPSFFATKASKPH